MNMTSGMRDPLFFSFHRFFFMQLNRLYKNNINEYKTSLYEHVKN